MSSTLGIILAAVGYRPISPTVLARQADELIRTARELRGKLESYRLAPDPFGALLSDMHNNHEFVKKFGDGH